MLEAGLAHGLHEAADAAVLAAVGGRHADALTERHQLIGRAAVAEHRAEALSPVDEIEFAGLDEAVVLVGGLDRRRARARVDAAGCIDEFAIQARLGAVEARQFVLQGFRQVRFGEQQQLVVEHHACRAHRAAGRRAVHADAALHVDRLAELAEQLLAKDVAGVRTDPARRFVTTGDDAVMRVVDRVGGFGLDDLGEHAGVRVRRQLMVGLGLRMNGTGQDQRQRTVAGHCQKARRGGD